MGHRAPNVDAQGVAEGIGDAECGLLARDREGTALLNIPPGTLKPGDYRATLVGEHASVAWTLHVH